MAEWRAKRFWSRAEVAPTETGYAVHLDARPIRTPAGRPLVVPTAALAQAVAEEWLAQGEAVDPRSMPQTRIANSAIDKVAAERIAVIALLREYGGTDLLCYRAEGPEALVAVEAAAWDPLLVWARRRFDAALTVTVGVMPAPQSTASLDRLSAPMDGMDAFTLTGFHDLVTLSGSLVIALAVWDGEIDAEEGWSRSRIDEEWQADLWGHDEIAEEEAAIKRRAFLDAERAIALART